MDKPGRYVPPNMHFDAADANIRACGAHPVALVIESARDPVCDRPFTGNMELVKLRQFIEQVGPANVPLGRITITNNSAGGQPAIANLRAVANLHHEYGILLFVEACRYAENAHFVFGAIVARPLCVSGYRIEYAPELLRRAARFAPVG